MSGYRSLHREKVGSFPIWKVVCSPVLTKSIKQQPLKSTAPCWRIWTAGGDGLVRGYLVQEKTLEMQKDVLDASACTCKCTHVLLGNQQSLPINAESALGCSQVQVARNYVGDDDNAGDLIVASMDMAGTVRIWSISEGVDEATSEAPSEFSALQEFQVGNATGTSLQVCPPNISGVGDVHLSIACLDGTVSIVATGLATPKSKKDPSPAGTVVDTWSKPGSIAMSGAWHPSRRNLAVGRQDGLVEILGDKPHRLIHHEAPVRAVAFTPDGHLLVSGSDDGMLAVWDASRTTPVLVHHVVSAHTSWILSLTVLGDSMRFITCGAEGELHVWDVGRMDQATHTFSCDDSVWTIHAATLSERQATTTSQQQPPRLVSGSEAGTLQIYSLEM